MSVASFFVFHQLLFVSGAKDQICHSSQMTLIEPRITTSFLVLHSVLMQVE